MSLLQIFLHFFALLLTVKGTSTSSSTSPGISSSRSTSSSITHGNIGSPAQAQEQQQQQQQQQQQLQPPEWLDVSTETIQEYMDKARHRHKQAIATARENYNLYEAKQYPADDELLNSLTLASFAVRSVGRLPDFHEQLDKKLYVTTPTTPLFTKDECRDCIKKAEAHFVANNNGQWTTLPSGQYDVAGFWINDVPAVKEWFMKMLQARLFPLLQRTFPDFVDTIDDLCVDNAYLFKYTPETGRRTDVHTDSGCLSFTIALNANDEYQGGGTWFEGLHSNDDDNHPSSTTGAGAGTGSGAGAGGIVEMNVGECTIRPGGVRHCGHAVTEGTRYIIGGFCMHSKRIEYTRMLLNLGQFGETTREKQTALEVAIALNPVFDGPYTNLADLLIKEGNTQKAKQVLEHCLTHVNPRCGEAAYSLGSLYLDEKNYAKTKECMQSCLDADESDIEAMLVMAQAHAGEGNTQGEREWYETIVHCGGANDQSKASAYCNLGVLHQGEPQEISYYKKALALKPEIFEARYSLACAYAVQQQWTEAVQEFRAALSYGGGREEEQLQAIKNLYKVTMEKIKTLHPQGVANREEIMNLFSEIMGKDNFDRLASMNKK